MHDSVLGSSVHEILQWVALSFSRDLSYPGVEPVSLALQQHSSLLNHQESPVSSLHKLKTRLIMIGKYSQA